MTMNQINENIIETAMSLKGEGFVVIIWTPEELGEVNQGYLEENVIEYGNNIIEAETSNGNCNNNI